MPKDYFGPDMTFIVGGFDKNDAYGKVFLFSIPKEKQSSHEIRGRRILE